MERTALLLTAFVVVAGAALHGQTASQKRSAFDVASVKPNTSGARQASIQMNLPDSFSATNQPLQSLVSLMYQVAVFKITGAPGWFATDRFDIVGKADRRLTIDEKREMIRTLLEDRFKLVTHRETHEGRMYALTFARGDHQLGPDIKRSRYDCDAINAARQRGDVSAIPTPPPVSRRRAVLSVADSSAHEV